MSEAALASNQGNNMAMYLNLSQGSSGQPGDLAMDLFQQYGGSNVQQSIDNIAAGAVGDVVNSVIDALPMPDFMRDAAKQQVAQALEGFQAETPAGLDDGVQNVLNNPGNAANALTDNAAANGNDLNALMGQMMQDVMNSANDNGEGGNWLAILARALGKVAGEHLKKMVELGEKMGQLDSKESPEEFAATQAEFQAEAQIFKMFQEAIGTMVKSIGEGMSSVARKQ